MTMISQGFPSSSLRHFLSTEKVKWRRRITGRRLRTFCWACRSRMHRLLDRWFYLRRARSDLPDATQCACKYSSREPASVSFSRQSRLKRAALGKLSLKVIASIQAFIGKISARRGKNSRAISMLWSVCGEGALATRNKLPYPWRGIRGWVRAAFSGGIKCHQFARGSR